MCGIFGILLSSTEASTLRRVAVQQGALVRHRGPDWSGCVIQELANGCRCALAHERLAIVGLASGEQPIMWDTGSSLCVNGEIYNHKALAESLPAEDQEKLVTGSDCEVVLPLVKKHGIVDATRMLDGQFAFILCDPTGKGACYAARDPIGIAPLYYGHGSDGSVWFGSELKSLEGKVSELKEFPPGHVWQWNGETNDSKIVKYRSLPWEEPAHPVEAGLEDRVEETLAIVRDVLEKSVVKRLMCDVPYGVLLSGGLDSSLVAAIAARHAAMRVEDDERSKAWFPRLHSFSIGLRGSPDLAAAAKVAKHIDTVINLVNVHHAFEFTLQQGLDALKDVIRHTETYDITTIRASTPMFLLARRIKAMGIKMVLSGEGADEVFGGYLYFHKAPNAKAFQEETVRKVLALHRYDCLRANKSMLAWGVEARVPFLDREVLDLVMQLPAEFKMVRPKPARLGKDERKVEKWLLRAAFDTIDDPYLPDEVLWRQKEQFSDGVGYGWIDGLRDYADSHVSDSQMASATMRFPVNTPTTKEGFLYRSIYAEHFPSRDAALVVPYDASVACSSAVALEWCAEWKGKADPSGRAVAGVHDDAYGQ